MVDVMTYMPLKMQTLGPGEVFLAIGMMYLHLEYLDPPKPQPPKKEND